MRMAAGDLFYPVSPFIYDNLLRCSDKTAFVHKYLEYDLHFSRVRVKLLQAHSFINSFLIKIRAKHSD